MLGCTAGCGSVARTYLLKVLEQGIKVGEICIHEGDEVITFGTPSKTKVPVNIYVRDERFWTHIFLCVSLVCLLSMALFTYSDWGGSTSKGIPTSVGLSSSLLPPS